MSCSMRIGIGYDIHPLKEGRALILGGIRIESSVGLSGHSDADVLLHAICDAILGALRLGDLGLHFPENEDHRDISSSILLERVRGMMADRGYRLGNLDCIVHAEEPRLSPFREKMEEKIAGLLQADPEKVSVKATRGEGMGPVGEKRAIAARAVVLVEKVEKT